MESYCEYEFNDCIPNRKCNSIFETHKTQFVVTEQENRNADCYSSGELLLTSNEIEILSVSDFVYVYSLLDNPNVAIFCNNSDEKITKVVVPVVKADEQLVINMWDDFGSSSKCNDFESEKSGSISTGNSNHTHGNFFFPLETTKKCNSSASTFQQLREPRSKYLRRFPLLFEEFFNSGDLYKLKVLLNDVLTTDAILLTQRTKPVVGRDKIYQQQCSMLRNIPDMYIVTSNVSYEKRGLITMTQKCFGTFPYANMNDESRKSWNFFETTTIEKLDEYHQIQKRKYDHLKSRNQQIRFESIITWQLKLDREAKHIMKFMTTNSTSQVEII